jgi:hypothetical protein
MEEKELKARIPTIDPKERLDDEPENVEKNADLFDDDWDVFIIQRDERTGTFRVCTACGLPSKA